MKIKGAFASVYVENVYVNPKFVFHKTMNEKQLNSILVSKFSQNVQFFVLPAKHSRGI